MRAAEARGEQRGEQRPGGADACASAAEGQQQPGGDGGGRAALPIMGGEDRLGPPSLPASLPARSRNAPHASPAPHPRFTPTFHSPAPAKPRLPVASAQQPAPSASPAVPGALRLSLPRRRSPRGGRHSQSGAHAGGCRGWRTKDFGKTLTALTGAQLLSSTREHKISGVSPQTSYSRHNPAPSCSQGCQQPVLYPSFCKSKGTGR